MKANKVLKLNYLSNCQKRLYHGTPVNRWKYQYAAGDGYFEQTHTYIERKNYEQPFNNADGHPDPPQYFHLPYASDFRYNLRLENVPARHFHTGLFLKYYNYNDTDSVMHGNEWIDMQPDYQIEEPMSSNHFIQQGPHTRALFYFMYVFIFGVVYGLYGYGGVDNLENPFPFRKKVFRPQDGFVFMRTNDFKDHDGKLHPQHDYVSYDNEGNILPRRIFSMPMLDEKIFRL